MRHFLILLFTISTLLLSGCNSAVSNLKPFKLEIQQGNVVTSKMLLQLRPGMTKSQVRFIMGTPLIVDSFHSNRWDYIFQLRQAGKITEQKRVVLDFDNEQLKSVRGDVMPTAEAGVVKLTPAAEVVAPKIKSSKDKDGESFADKIDKLKFWKDDKATVAVDQKIEPVKIEPQKIELKEAAAQSEASKIDLPVAVIATNVAAMQEPVKPVEDVVTTPLNDMASPTPSAPVESAAVLPAPTLPIVIATSTRIASNIPLPIPSTKTNTGALADYELKFDRTLDFNRGNVSNEIKSQKVNPKESTTPAKNKSANPSAESGYFERILEKIGF